MALTRGNECYKIGKSPWNPWWTFPCLQSMWCKLLFTAFDGYKIGIWSLFALLAVYM